jgi:hypothetical protein
MLIFQTYTESPFQGTNVEAFRVTFNIWVIFKQLNNDKYFVSMLLYDRKKDTE